MYSAVNAGAISPVSSSFILPRWIFFSRKRVYNGRISTNIRLFIQLPLVLGYRGGTNSSLNVYIYSNSIAARKNTKERMNKIRTWKQLRRGFKIYSTQYTTTIRSFINSINYLEWNIPS